MNHETAMSDSGEHLGLRSVLPCPGHFQSPGGLGRNPKEEFCHS